MFGSTPTKSEAPFRRQAARLWRRASMIGRHASLRLAVLLYGERVDPETLAVTLDGERHLIMGIWAQLAVQSSAEGEGGSGGDGATRSGEDPPLSPSSCLPVSPSLRVPDAELTSREAEQTSSLLAITGETLTSLDPAAALQSVVDQARHALDVDLAALLMLSPDGDSLELVAVAGEESRLEPQRRLSVAGSISGQAIRSGRPFTCLDTLAGGVQPVGCHHPAGTPAASGVSAPVGSGGELVGALEVC